MKTIEQLILRAFEIGKEIGKTEVKLASIPVDDEDFRNQLKQHQCTLCTELSMLRWFVEKNEVLKDENH